jgi:xanthine dehydrogenase accessory factor
VKTLIETFDAIDILAARSLEQAEARGAFATLSRLDDENRIARTLVLSDGDDRAGTAYPFANMSFCEKFGEVTTPVLLFGAGHVGRAVVLALAPLPFTVRWIDGRSDQFPQYVPRNVVSICTEAADRELAESQRDALVVVMTHSDALDFDIAVGALQRRTFDFVGLIGSETKRARFVTWARQMGMPKRGIDRLVCPIGITEIKGKAPAVIAAALAAQLLLVREQALAPQPSKVGEVV